MIRNLIDRTGDHHGPVTMTYQDHLVQVIILDYLHDILDVS